MANAVAARGLPYVTMNLYYLGLSFMWNSIGRFLLQALLPLPHMAGRDHAEAALGAIGFVGLLIASIVQPLAGAFSDRISTRWGRRRPFLFAFTFSDLFFLAGIAFAPNLFFLLLAYCLLQFSSNLAHGPYQGLLSDLVPVERRGRAASVKQFVETAGIILVAVVLPIIFSNARAVESNAQTALGLAAIILVGTMLATVARVREPITTAPTAREKFYFDPRAARQFARAYPDFVWLIATRWCTLGALALLGNYAQFYFQKVLFADISDLNLQIQSAVKLQGELLTGLVLALIGFTLIAGPLSDRIGRRPVVAFGSLLAGAGALELLFSHNTPLVQFSFFTLTDLHAGGLLIGIGMGFFTSANWAWAIDLAPREQGGKFLGLTNLATAGATVVTSLFGPIISFLNARDAGSGFTLMFFVALIGFFLGAVLLGNVKETAGKKSPIANGK